MTHPHVLHAGANLWSLRRSWPQLRAAQEAARVAAADDADRGTLQAWRPGSGRAGAYSDGMLAVLDNAAAATAVHYDRLAERVREHVEQAYWLAVSDLGCQMDGHGLLARVAGAILRVSPVTARDIAAELAAADRVCRTALRITPDLWPLPGAPACPWCGVRMLRAQTSAPASADWTVVCAAGCRCVGDGCTCGMAVPERGVVHIWDRTAPLVAEQLARLRIRRRRLSRADTLHA